MFNPFGPVDASFYFSRIVWYEKITIQLKKCVCVCIISKWPFSPYIKKVIIYNTLNRNRENLRQRKNYHKNESENDHT